MVTWPYLNPANMATTRNGSVVSCKPNSMASARKARDEPVDLGLCSDGAGGWSVTRNEPFKTEF